MYATVRDTTLYFDIDSAGLVADGPTMREMPAAFLIHGGPGTDHTGLKGAFAPLAGRLQLIFFDHRGNGRSARGNPEKYTLDENVEDMEALRRHLGLGPIVSIGTSYGASVAMAHAARYPRAVSLLVLNGATSHGGNLQLARKIVRARGTHEQVQQLEDLLAGQITTPAKLKHFMLVMGPLYSMKHDASLAELSLNRMILSPEALNRAWGPGGCMLACDLRPELAAIDAPTLILAGRHDWICPPELSVEIREMIPRSDLRIFENSSHSIRADEPQAFIDAIVGFLVYQPRSSHHGSDPV